MQSTSLPKGDQKLVRIVESALADATRRSGAWLACRPGCTQCCFGVFSISQLDALRLSQGLHELESRDPQRAGAIRERARAAIEHLAAEFPGNPKTGILADDEAAEARFEDFANDEPCPVLDPATGHCELYESRPLTCRAFGPPVRSEDGLGVCELCFQGASEEEIAKCEMEVDPEDLEARLLEELHEAGTPSGRTIVPFAVAD
jgi:Fe-S-cluster containining protein